MCFREFYSPTTSLSFCGGFSLGWGERTGEPRFDAHGSRERSPTPNKYSSAILSAEATQFHSNAFFLSDVAATGFQHSHAPVRGEAGGDVYN
jgi:hypothetical protein